MKITKYITVGIGLFFSSGLLGPVRAVILDFNNLNPNPRPQFAPVTYGYQNPPIQSDERAGRISVPSQAFMLERPSASSDLPRNGTTYYADPNGGAVLTLDQSGAANFSFLTFQVADYDPSNINTGGQVISITGSKVGGGTVTHTYTTLAHPPGTYSFQTVVLPNTFFGLERVIISSPGTIGYDDFSIVPEPGTFGMVGIVLVFAAAGNRIRRHLAPL